MEYLILTETEFFGLINGSDETAGLNAAYSRFVKAVVELMHDGDTDGAKIALAYAENELQYHHTQYIAGVRSHTALFVRKALSFIRKMQKHIPPTRPQVPPLSTTIHSECEKKNEMPVNAPSMRWTGSMAELVELIYGLDAMKLVNEGETGIKELLDGFCKIKELPGVVKSMGQTACAITDHGVMYGHYNTYADIKRRKNDSRTYFFDKAAEKLNRRMQEDEERERMRKR